uniref:Uncharacterized protein n=1 Tax=Hordeum vulgare subsp. vulgare TaxID=112509 RepID=A0A8I6Y9L4_HORVV
MCVVLSESFCCMYNCRNSVSCIKQDLLVALFSFVSAPLSVINYVSWTKIHTNILFFSCNYYTRKTHTVSTFLRFYLLQQRVLCFIVQVS